MRKISILIGVACGLVSVQPALAAPAKPAIVAPPPLVRTNVAPLPAPGPVTPSRQALADRLANITQPEALMIESVTMGWDRALKEDRSSFDELNKIKSGLGEDLIARGREELIALVTAELPPFRRKIATIYAEGATDADLTKLIAFYTSPTGQKIVRNVIMSDRDAGLEDGKITVDEMKAVNRAAAMDLLKSLTADDRKNLMVFALSSYGARGRQIGPKIQAESAAWLNNVMTQYNNRLPAIYEELMVKHGLTKKN